MFHSGGEFIFPTWAAQSRGVAAGGEWSVAGNTFNGGEGRLKTQRLVGSRGVDVDKLSVLIS